MWKDLWLSLSSPIGLLALVVILFVAMLVAFLINMPPATPDEPASEKHGKAAVANAPSEEGSRTRKVLTGIFLGLFLVDLATLCVALGEDSWGIILALVPPVLMVQHAVFLRIVRKPKLVPESPESLGRARRGQVHPVEAPPGQPVEGGAEPASATPGKPDLENDWWRSVVTAAKSTSDSYFGLGSLALRYGTSALVFLLVAIVAFFALFAEDRMIANEHYTRYASPAALGTAGAYVYALLYLGRRNITHDVTSGGAMWCSISLAAGPILACVVSRFLTNGSGKSDLDLGVLYFMAGFSPRYVTAYVEGIARKSWPASPVAHVPESRTIPLTQVKGITAETAERLAEEGISDLHSLAMADPLRLIRNTNFDKRLIVSWIDEALLITKLPDTWEFLEKEGVSGAIDLIELVWPPPYPPYQEKHGDHRDKKNSYLHDIGDRLNTQPNQAEPKHGDTWLTGVATLLYDDEQVRRIWVLHNHLSEA